MKALSKKPSTETNITGIKKPTGPSKSGSIDEQDLLD